ncbi:hypothetical protein H9Q69_010516 [Fusarium xylarioides]|nr:hypothetical protein H9Q69_010516 [Fusarium xylarioides]
MLLQNIGIKVVQLDFEQDDQQAGDCLIGQRNVHAMQSALIRGDEEVILFNWNSIPPRLWQGLHLTQNHIGQAAVGHFTDFAPRNAPCDPLGNLSRDARNSIENKRWHGMKFKFIKVLAEGGHGYATLWDVVFEDKSVRRVVIKRAINPLTKAFDPHEEARFHLRYDGAQHTTQVIDLYREAMAIRTRMIKNGTFTHSAVRPGKEWKAEEQNCVVFEYMKFGDMVNIMQIVGTRKVQIPAQVLWGIWECLVLGLATIAYTPSNSSGNSSFETWWKDVVSDREEAIAFLDRVEREWKIEHDVHFDLEVFNVLAGHDPATHPNQPVFKLHDLGAWSFNMNHGWESYNEDQIWQLRGPVKLHATTPEQFSKEWDDVYISLPTPVLRQLFGGEDLEKWDGTEVAGRYGIWTNIFLVAKVMESIITGEMCSFPYRTVIHDRTNKPTYGGRLQSPQFHHIDLELRDIVASCLHEKPKDRPRITHLLRNVLDRKQLGFNNEDSESVHRWWETLFEPQQPNPIPSQAPPPANPVKQAVVASAAKGGPAIASHMAQAARNQGVPNQPQVPPHIPPHIQQILNQRRAQPDIKGPPAQPPAQPPVRPPVQPQAPPKVLPHLQHVPTHLRNLPFDQRGTQPGVREPHAQHQAPPQAQAPPQVQAQAPPKHNLRFSFKPNGLGLLLKLLLKLLLEARINVKSSAKSSLKSTGPKPSTKVSTKVSTKADVKVNFEVNVKVSVRASIEFSPEPGLKSNVKLTGLDPSLKFNLKFNLKLSSLKFDLEPSLMFHLTYEGANKMVSKKAPKAKKASRKVPPQKHDAIAEYVKKVLPDMPVAIRNLLTRSQHLESQLEKDGFPVYTFVN